MWNSHKIKECNKLNHKTVSYESLSSKVCYNFLGNFGIATALLLWR